MSNKDIPISSYISRLRYDENNIQASASAKRREYQSAAANAAELAAKASKDMHVIYTTEFNIEQEEPAILKQQARGSNDYVTQKMQTHDQGADIDCDGQASLKKPSDNISKQSVY